MPVLPEETAIALFAERAKAVQGRFELDERNRPIVTVIMRGLDGIPLAIELAASRVKLLSVDRIAEALDERFTLLVGAAVRRSRASRRCAHSSGGAMIS